MAGRSAEKSEFRWYHGLVFALSVELGAFFLCTDWCRERFLQGYLQADHPGGFR